MHADVAPCSCSCSCRNSSTATTSVLAVAATPPSAACRQPEGMQQSASHVEAVQCHAQRFAHHAQEQRAHAGIEPVGVAASHRDQANARQRQQRSGLHFARLCSVEQRVLVGLQAAADGLAIAQAIAKRGKPCIIGCDDLQPVGVQRVDRLEQHQPHQFAVEIFRQRSGHRLERVGRAGLAHQCQRELMRAHRQPLVLLRIAAQLLQAPRQFAILVAQHFELVGRQRSGGAVVARHQQAHCQIRELLEEGRVTSQPGGDFMCAEFVRVLAHPFHSPSKTNTAGPDMTTCSWSQGQRMRSSPPGKDTCTSRSTRQRCISTTAAAQAPLPQASVSPTPRSNTRKRTCVGSTTCTKPTLTESGNAAFCCSSVPTRSTGAASTRPTSTTACGLPIDTAPKRTVSPCTGSAYSSRACANPASGIWGGSNCGIPIATA
ncbi:hypothetical protein XOO3995 [Xanthomonas oryzae pv. oryzae KACC 10331]|uniref:Uncharacterized protein n=1 Tax=Xanthomonas oryzae pv. oryzae (strain KACC10331 / KXO85) TaxID=291331 RepID=Q5GVM4_XANOR|nr:hypothetical protein XOO3995 [Xanthomonas oryzae pv. oryzae KACC 10331]